MTCTWKSPHGCSADGLGLKIVITLVVENIIFYLHMLNVFLSTSLSELLSPLLKWWFCLLLWQRPTAFWSCSAHLLDQDAELDSGTAPYQLWIGKPPMNRQATRTIVATEECRNWLNDCGYRRVQVHWNHWYSTRCKRRVRANLMREILPT